jgi:hypothetical protein
MLINSDKRIADPIPEREGAEAGKIHFDICGDSAANRYDIVALDVQMIEREQHMLMRAGVNIAMMMLGQ